MIKKTFLKSKPVCKATFTLPKKAVNGAKKVQLLGEFNDWKANKTTELDKLKNGNFKTTVEVESGKTYQFRYLVDGKEWLNDDQPDALVSNEFGAENCVLDARNN